MSFQSCKYYLKFFTNFDAMGSEQVEFFGHHDAAFKMSFSTFLKTFKACQYSTFKETNHI